MYKRQAEKNLQAIQARDLSGLRGAQLRDAEALLRAAEQRVEVLKELETILEGQRVEGEGAQERIQQTRRQQQTQQSADRLQRAAAQKRLEILQEEIDLEGQALSLSQNQEAIDLARQKVAEAKTDEEKEQYQLLPLIHI